MMKISTFANEVEFLNTVARITLNKEDVEFIFNMENGLIELDITDTNETTRDLLTKRFAGYIPLGF